MKIEEFASSIEEDKDLSIVTFDDKKDCFIVRNEKLKEDYECTFEAVCAQDWQNIGRVLHGGEAEVLEGRTRIVGYFSKVKNWNKGKLGELKDRQGGKYTI